MPRIKIELPERFPFTTEIAVRITDVNYGGHVGNDSILSLIHEARVRFLHAHQYTELDLAGTGLIMADVAIEFRNELFYGETLRVSVAATEFTRVGFELLYKFEKLSGEKWVLVASAKTGMVCYDYSLKKVVSVPREVCSRLLG